MYGGYSGQLWFIMFKNNEIENVINQANIDFTYYSISQMV